MRAPTRVLTNVVELHGNPYLRLWDEAARRAGAAPEPLSLGSVLSAGRPGWVHLQWPERVLQRRGRADAARRLGKLLVLVALARLRRARVLVTIHNVWSHARLHPRLERVMWRALGWLATDVHLLSGAAAGEVFAAHPRLRRAEMHVIPHGDYAPLAEGAPDREEARARLDIDAAAPVLLTFGALRSYKGVEELLDAFAHHPDPAARLLIAGRVDDETLEEDIRRAQAADARVVPLLRFVADDELAALIRAADCVVLPYRQILNSGSAMLALSFARPVLLPRTPTFDELARRVGEPWVRRFDGTIDSMDLAEIPPRPPSGAPDLDWCSWEGISRQLAGLWGAGTPAHG